ncbi:MAG: hypothetical protein JTT11_06645 [Candidatus Brockarchaeota archaeon]|nr:hypothetical protein [Candidatus Brockarchaeota archaeon]
MIPGTVVTSADGSTIGYVRKVHGNEGEPTVDRAPVAELIVDPEGLKSALDFEQTVSKIAEHMGLEVRDDPEYVMSCAAERLAEAGGQLSMDDVFPSYVYYFDLPIEYSSPVWKSLVNVSSFRANPESALLANLDFDLFFIPVEMVKKSRLDYEELAGEWFIGKVEGIVAHYSQSGGPQPSARTGLVGPTFELRSQETRFTLSTCDVLTKVSFRDHVSLGPGEAVAVKGNYDFAGGRIRASSLLRVKALELWIDQGVY